MLTLLRHLLAIVALPVTVTILIPVWIARKNDVRWATPANFAEILLSMIGLVLLLLGLLLFATCVWRFATKGLGTLAPWDPPRQLVVNGAYRFVRNPMISGVILILFAETCLLRSMPHAIWASAFVALNLVFIPLLEEPNWKHALVMTTGDTRNMFLVSCRDCGLGGESRQESIQER